MVFSSVTFLFCFLPLFLLGYFVLLKKHRMGWLLFVSLVFYAWGEPVFVLLMIASILVNWGIGLLMERRPKNKKALLIISCALDLGVLAVFKYTGFLTDTLRGLPGLGALPRADIALPIGISFFTFQILSYVIDVYRGKVRVQRDLVMFGAYVSMFPQLIAGPIVRYADIEQYLDRPDISKKNLHRGLVRFLIGLSKKLLLANPMGLLWGELAAAPMTNGLLGSWVGIIAYTFQIYFDFSAYSDMALGLGLMIGIPFQENFRYPYMADSITEFWRRWHISLSGWFKEYVYIPLGGNRKGLPRQILNLLIVWGLTGLWHGASWNFVLWGLYFAVLLILEKLFLLKALQRAGAAVSHGYALLFITLGWALFYFTDFSALGVFMKSLVMNEAGFCSSASRALILGYLPRLLLCALGSTPLAAGVGRKLFRGRGRWAALVLFVLLFVLCAAALAGRSYNPFIYFRF